MKAADSPIVITGGAQRLGLAMALGLHESHAPVVITYRRERPSLDDLRDRGIVTLQVDFDCNNSILAFTEELRQRYSSLRAIIHNASEWMGEGGDHDDAEVLQRMMTVHVAAPYLINRELTPLLERHADATGHADIIHMSDYVADTGSRKHLAYEASKAALNNLNLSFASSLAPRIKVNGIAPSMLMFNTHDDDEYRARARSKSLLEVAPGAGECLNTARYLLDSRYLTGKTLGLDGGRPLARAS